METANFGDVLKKTFHNNYIELYDFIELEITGIPLKNLCYNYHNYIMKRVGFDFLLKKSSASEYLIDSFKYNYISDTERSLLDCYLEQDYRGENRLGIRRLPFFLMSSFQKRITQAKILKNIK